MGTGASSTGGAASVPRAARVVSADMGDAWLLDTKSFHDEFDELFARLGERDGLERLWGRALGVYGHPDAGVRRYLATVETRPPELWAAAFDESHLAESYRILMAAHLAPTPGLRSPTAIKDRLPDLGWSRADARKLAFGRELGNLAEHYADPDCAAVLSAGLPLGNKGWLSQQDISGFLDRFRSMPADAFRGHQNLVPLVEEIYGMLGAAAAANNRVLLLPPS
jgi:hypothetical protein